MSRLVYFFGQGKADGTRDMKSVLGGKGAGLAEMTNIGVPVPPGFTIACESCVAFLASQRVPDGLREEVQANLQRLEAATGRTLGDPKNPLLVSVRSGAPSSMPGMMETILNLGLNDATTAGLAAQSANPRFAYDSYRRFLQMYGDVVLDVPSAEFEQLLRSKRMSQGVTVDSELDGNALRTLAEEYKTLVRTRTGADFPQDPQAQLWGAIEAVWRSWMLKKAVDYRRVNRIPETVGTAVNIQAMVFGNIGDDSGSGVAFTRDPSTGEKRFYGEFLVNAQGEDVVAGIRTPIAIEEMAHRLPAAYPVAPRRAGPHREALPRHAGPGVHRGARHALHAPDAHGQAHRRGRGADRRRHGAREADRPHDRGAPRAAAAARPAPASRSSTPPRTRRRSPPGCRRAPAPRAARRCSIRMSRSSARRRANT